VARCFCNPKFGGIAVLLYSRDGRDVHQVTRGASDDLRCSDDRYRWSDDLLVSIESIDLRVSCAGAGAWRLLFADGRVRRQRRSVLQHAVTMSPASISDCYPSN
jgi:hypothetical protein